MNSSSLSFTALELDTQKSAYFQWTDEEDGSPFILAVAETSSAVDSDVQFMRELFRSNGERFGAEFLVSPPTEVVASFSRLQLSEWFESAASVAVKKYTTYDDFWEEVRKIAAKKLPNTFALFSAGRRKRSARLELMNSYLDVVWYGQTKYAKMMGCAMRQLRPCTRAHGIASGRSTLFYALDLNSSSYLS